MIYTDKVRSIISMEKEYLDYVANEWVKGNEDFANKQMYRLFIKYGWTSDTNETNQLLDYVGTVISLFMKQGGEVWKQIPSYKDYECTSDGSVRRLDNKHILKVDNDRVKLTVNGKVTTVRVSNLVYETFYMSEEEIKDNDVMIDISSEL